MIAVCKCHPKFAPGGAETGTSAGGEGQEYEEVDGGGGGVAVNDPTYIHGSWRWRTRRREHL